MNIERGRRKHIKDQRNSDLHSDSIFRQPGEASLVSSSSHSQSRNARHENLVHGATIASRRQEVERAVRDEVQETVSRHQGSEPRAEQEALLVEALPYPRSSVRASVPLQDSFGHGPCASQHQCLHHWSMRDKRLLKEIILTSYTRLVLTRFCNNCLLISKTSSPVVKHGFHCWDESQRH